MFNYSSPFSNFANFNGTFISKNKPEDDFDYFSSQPIQKNSQSASSINQEIEKQKKKQNNLFKLEDNKKEEDDSNNNEPEINIYLDPKLAKKNPKINIFYCPKNGNTPNKIDFSCGIKDKDYDKVNNNTSKGSKGFNPFKTSERKENGMYVKFVFDEECNFVNKRIGNIRLGNLGKFNQDLDNNNNFY